MSNITEFKVEINVPQEEIDDIISTFTIQELRHISEGYILLKTRFIEKTFPKSMPPLTAEDLKLVGRGMYDPSGLLAPSVRKFGDDVTEILIGYDKYLARESE